MGASVGDCVGVDSVGTSVGASVETPSSFKVGEGYADEVGAREGSSFEPSTEIFVFSVLDEEEANELVEEEADEVGANVNSSSSNLRVCKLPWLLIE
jgi:hypothetical protein